MADNRDETRHIIVEVNETSSTADKREDSNMEQKRKQNALPDWHKNSTIVLEQPELSSAVTPISMDSNAESMPNKAYLEPGAVIAAGDEDDAEDIMGFYDNYYSTYVDADDDEEFVEVSLPDAPNNTLSTELPVETATNPNDLKILESDDDNEDFVDVDLEAGQNEIKDDTQQRKKSKLS